MPEFDSRDENPEEAAHNMEDLQREPTEGNSEENQSPEAPSFGAVDSGEGNSNQHFEANVSENIPSPQHPSEEGSVANSLDGLEEIVKPQEVQNNDEASEKDEAIDDLAHIIEAIIFASDEPLNIGTLKSVLDASHTFGRVNPDMIISRINALNNKYDSDGSGFHIIEIAEGYQFATRKELAQWVSYLFKEKAKRRLSNSALETLAIIAYKQPITKPEIESIRGVNVDYVLHNLLEKEIVTVVGRAETVGRPLLYGTTQRFLKVFGLRNLEDLPKLREIEEIIKEIRSKGAEESIQLEITALGDQVAIEPMSSASSPDAGIPSSDSSEKQEIEVQKDPATDETIPKE
jgi:segregation and condensation protein B